jgi:AbrB family looped-hinge helix DNA binding protein
LDLRIIISVNGELKMTARITTNGRLTIPSRLRRRFGIKPGTPIVFWEENNRIIFQPVTREYINSFCGVFKKKPGEKSVVQELIEERRAETKWRRTGRPRPDAKLPPQIRNPRR